MVDKYAVVLLEGYGPLNAGEVGGYPLEEARDLVRDGRAKWHGDPPDAVSTSPDTPPEDRAVAASSKSDPDTRDRLDQMAERTEIKAALDEGDYYEMRALLDELTDTSVGNPTKADVIERLESMLDD